MNEELHIKLQAFLDGELPEAEAREISSLIARDADAAALHRELKHTRAAIAGFENRITVPETREFYWSKIRRDIQQLETPEPEAPRHSLFSFWRRTLAMSGGFAALVIALLVGTTFGHRTPGTEIALAEGDAFTYRNYESGTTLVWLSYPAENGLAENQPAATLQ